MLADILSAKNRKIFYALFALLGVALGATAVGFGAAAVAIPVWLKVALAVYAFVGGPLGAVARANVASEKPSQPI